MTYALEGYSWPLFEQPITWDFAPVTLAKDQAYPLSDAITQYDAQQVIITAIEAWSRVTGLQFVSAPADGVSVDIRIGWGEFPAVADTGQEIGETVIRHYVGTGMLAPDALIRLLDPAQLALYENAGTLSYSDYDSTTLYQVVLHELGHAIGLAHDEDNPAAVMYPTVGSGNRQLSPDDIAGAQALYGVPAAQTIDIGGNQEIVSGSQSGAPSTVYGSSGVLDYDGGLGVIVLDDGSARVHDGVVTVFAGAAPLVAYNNLSGMFILGSSYSGISGGGAGTTDIVFGGTGAFAYVGAQESASVIGGSGSATITGGAGGGYYLGGSDGSNSLTATGIGTVLVGGGSNDTLVGANAGYSYLVAGSGNETLIGSIGLAGSAGTDRFYLGSGADAVGLGTSESELVTGSGTATIYGGGGHADLFGGTGGADLFVETARSNMVITGFRMGVDHVDVAGASAISVSGGSTLLSFTDGATILLNNLVDPSGAGLS